MPDDRAAGDTALRPAASPDDALWDDGDTPLRVPTAPVLHLDGFDGPIDLLLDLAERQRLDLGRISLIALVDQFVAAPAQLAAQIEDFETGAVRLMSRTALTSDRLSAA